MAELGAYKSGKSAGAGIWGASFAAVPNARHLIDNLYIEGAASEALCHAYLSIVDAETGALLGFGRYRDEVVRTASGWRIRSRVFTAG